MRIEQTAVHVGEGRACDDAYLVRKYVENAPSLPLRQVHSSAHVGAIFHEAQRVLVRARGMVDAQGTDVSC